MKYDLANDPDYNGEVRIIFRLMIKQMKDGTISITLVLEVSH